MHNSTQNHQPATPRMSPFALAYTHKPWSKRPRRSLTRHLNSLNSFHVEYEEEGGSGHPAEAVPEPLHCVKALWMNQTDNELQRRNETN